MGIQAGCLFCTDQPCDMHADKPGKKRAAKKLRPVENVPTPPVLAPSETDDEWIEAPKAGRFHIEAEPELTYDQRMEREAIRNLWSILSDSDKYKYRDIMDPPKNAAMSKRSSEVRRLLDGVLGRVET